jgi:C-terminal processing protease CtpA/Prc
MDMPRLGRAIRWLSAACLALPGLAVSLSAQASADSARLDRVVALGKLWGAIGLFHPYLAYRPINWDSALVVALPLAERATTRAEFAAAVTRMLAPLDDPATRVLPQARPGKPTASDSTSFTRWLSDSILLVHLSVVAGLGAFEEIGRRLTELGPLLPTARAVILDFRVEPGAPDMEMIGFMWPESGVDSFLVADTVLGAGQRSRIYSGWTPEDGGTSGGYFAAWRTSDATMLLPSHVARTMPIVVLANARGALPPTIAALIGAGRAALVIEGGAPPNSSGSVRLELPDSLVVEVRVSEPVDQLGRSGVTADAVVEESTVRGDENAAFLTAMRMARGERATPTAPVTLPAVATAAAARPYREMAYPSQEYRLLAAFRIYTIMEYFHPYRDLYGEDWNQVLRNAIPQFVAARDSLEYALAVARMVSHIHDSHGFIVSPTLAAWRGRSPTPVIVRYIEHLPVIVGFLNDSAGRAAGARIGDVILTVDGVPASQRAALLAPAIASSTPQSLEENLAWQLLLGRDSTTAEVSVRGADGRTRPLTLQRRLVYREAAGPKRSGDILKLLPGNIGYADLDRLPPTMVDSMFERFKDTKAIIFDMRGYPQGTAWSIGPRLTDRNDVPAARFAKPIVDYPHGTSNAESGEPRTTFEFVQSLPRTEQWRYHGKTVMLIDGRTGSQAEHTGLFFESANGTVFIGSPTVGANGDVTNFYVPGGILIYFSGQGVRHLDGRQLQRVGLQPTILVTPTIAGVRAGRDEVLERALKYLGAPSH